jgi:hypothetical protein
MIENHNLVTAMNFNKPVVRRIEKLNDEISLTEGNT